MDKKWFRLRCNTLGFFQGREPPGVPEITSANSFPSGKYFFLDVEAIGFLSGNEELSHLSGKSSNDEGTHLNTMTNNFADRPREARGVRSQREKEPFPDEN
ncbi:hypothetical protein [Desulfonatronospira sp.]|uniref:hypothetical protein n=1 Tax=Desulfonatronospira sp. TaxID=1962951 RepID=UPI0025C27918|nr:hypothetical protein [Desulfonatronospira sp.]